MFFTKHRQLFRWVIVAASFAIVSLILWNTYVFFQKFKEEERAKMKTWSYAHADLAQSVIDINANVNPLTTHIITDTTITTPMLVFTKDGELNNTNNIDTSNIKDVKRYINKLKTRFQEQNQPIPLSYKLKNKTIDIGTLYYGNAPLLNKLKYYPLALLLIIVLFGTVVYLFYKSNKNAIQNKLWTGMAKETAHQIGTPLSSLIGWTEILKTENVDPDYILEIEKDIDRLKTITDRFSKIGSIPVLEKADIVEETKTSFDYLKTRSSKLINFSLKLPMTPVYVNLNKQLYSWTIENLVKNAIDAMKGKGDLTIEMVALEKYVSIKIIDTGKGIAKSQFNTIFEPGYTSKKRGWGLGLSLAKRIIEEFHDGKIKVLQSEIGKGTTLQIALKKL
ncbi:sensor histidine kinase [Pontimicrobium sp. MEBiC01747]|jgi:signal transduction histidine kinase